MEDTTKNTAPNSADDSLKKEDATTPATETETKTEAPKSSKDRDKARDAYEERMYKRFDKKEKELDFKNIFYDLGGKKEAYESVLKLKQDEIHKGVTEKTVIGWMTDKGSLIKHAFHTPKTINSVSSTFGAADTAPILENYTTKLKALFNGRDGVNTAKITPDLVKGIINIFDNKK